MNNTRVSVIVPVYNTPLDLLKRSLGSVLNQTYDNTELVVIDDMSPNPAVWEYIDSLESTDYCRIVKLRKEYNKGTSDSLNIGLKISSGDFYCILDHDDYIKPEYIERMVRCATDNNADLVVCGMEQIDSEGRKISRFPERNEDYDNRGFPWSSPANLARIYKRQMALDGGIVYPVGCWTEDIIFTAQAYFIYKRTAVLKFEGYVNFINPSSASRSNNYYKLSGNQIPFQMINELIDRNACDRKAYISGLLVNEMMLVEYLLTLSSSKSVRSTVSLEFRNSMKKLKCKTNELKTYQKIIGSGNVTKTLERIFLISHNTGIDRLVKPVVSMALRVYYRRKRDV